MAVDNVTPIYGEWLVNHIEYYNFIGESARALKRDLLSIDITSSDSDRILIECYQKFTSMFVYDVYDTAFGQYTEGITAINNKGFLVCNQYNVWTPIGFMEDNGRGVALDLEFTNSVTNRKINEKAAELKMVWEKCKKTTDELDKWEKKLKPSIIKAFVTMALCICVVVFFALNRKSLLDMDFRFPLVMVWGIAVLIVSVGAIKGICEIKAIRRWKKLEYLVTWFQNFIPQGVGNDSVLVEYKEQLAVLEQGGTEYNLPKPSRELQEYLRFLQGRANALQTILNNPRKLKGKIGLLTIMFLGAVLVFVAYGQNHWTIMETMRHKEEDVDLTETESTSGKDAQKVLTGCNVISIANATATSELITKTRTYSIMLSCDGDLSTCWQDGVEGDGTGEVLVYYFDQPRYIVAMDIVNGRVISEEKYYDNNRIATMTLYYFSNGEVTASVEIVLEDVYGTEPVHYELTEGLMDEKYNCEGIQIVIESIYTGNKYNDLCLTDICFYEGVYE